MNPLEEAAKSFQTAMKGLGTDEARIIKELTKHSKDEIQVIKATYQNMFGHTLAEDLSSETSGKFRQGILALLEPTCDYEAKCVRNAIKGLGTDELVLIQILCPKEPHEIQELKEAYNRLFKRSLDNDIQDEQNGPLGRMFRSLVNANRPYNEQVDTDLAEKEAKELFAAGPARWGTDELEFVRIFCSRSFSQLRETFEEYYKLAKVDIEKTIKDEMSGDLKRAILAIVKTIRNKSGYYAEQLYEAMKGMGTDDDTLIRLLVSRCEIDLAEIKSEYKRLYKKSLHDAVKSELSGDYEKLFLGLIGKV